MKIKKLARLMAFLLALCLMISCFGGCNENKTSSDPVSSDNSLLYGNASDYDDDDDDVTDGDSLITNNSGSDTGTGTGNGTGTTVGKPITNIEIDEEGKKDFLSSVPKKLNGTTVRVLVWWEPGTAEVAKAQAFEKATGIKIKWIKTGGNDAYYTKLSALIGQDNAPDLACVKQNNFPSCVIQNYFEPITVGKLDLSDKVYDIETMNQFKWNGKHYGALIKNSTMVTFYSCVFNKELYSQAGIKNPYEMWQAGNWNWDTFVSSALELKNKLGLEYPVTATYSGYYFVNSAATDIIKFDDGKIINNAKDQKLVDAWTQLRSMVFDYKIMATSGSQSQFFGRTAALLMDGNYIMQNGDVLAKNCKFDWGYAPIPSPKGQKLVIPSQVKMWGFPRGSKNAEAAGYWLRYWQDPSFDTAGKELWVDDDVASFNNWLWEQPKQFENYIGIINYGGNYSYQTLTSEMMSSSANVKTVLDKWYDTINGNISKMTGK